MSEKQHISRICRKPFCFMAGTVALLLSGCTGEPESALGLQIPQGIGQRSTDPSTFRERVFYEAWVRSVQDSDGDGIGDLPGMIERLPQLADLGIGGIWMMPTFPSPLADSGYDVADYTAVHPDYGSMQDMEEFIAAAHDHNLLVYLDMVFNHTSDQHKWFQSALTGPQSPYFNYFVWATEPTTSCVDVPAGPFGTERWTEVEDLGLYYFHQFYPRQPDLNFENPEVQDALLGVLEFWMDKGVDGFRFDVPDRFFENGNHCTHQPETVAFHKRLRETISGTGTLQRGFVGEIWGTVDQNMDFFGPEGNPMIFNFELLFAMYASIIAGDSPHAVAQATKAMLGPLPDESRWGIINGNHDVPRMAQLLNGDTERLKLAASIQLTLPGVPFLWMGEELGMPTGEQFNVDWRDGMRVPYAWEEEAGLGFSTHDTPHLAFAPRSAEFAYATQITDPYSLLNHYRRVIAVRNTHTGLQSKEYRELYRDDDLWIYERGTGNTAVTVVHNVTRRHVRALPAEAIVANRSFNQLNEIRYEPGMRIGPNQSLILTRQ